MSLDTVAQPSSASRAASARNATASSASRSDPSPGSGDFANLMQGLGERTPSTDPLASRAQDRNDRPKTQNRDQGNQDAAASAAANAAAAHQAARDTASGNRDRGDSARASTPRTEAAPGDVRQVDAKNGSDPAHGVAGKGASDSVQSTNGSAAGNDGAPAAGDGSSSYLRQVAFLQQLADAAASGGSNTGVTGTTLTASANGALASPAQAADAAAQRLQTLLTDAMQAGAAATPAQTPAAGPDVMTTLALAGATEGAGRSPSRLPGSDARQAADTAAVALMGATSTAADVRFDVPAAAPDAGATTEMRVAQQVTYWVGKGVQNAAMEVQGIAEKPIHVSIAVQGQEARVTLQAEQLQTQQILQASAPHLKELLQTQGMVLSSLTVGGSGAGSAGNGGGNATPRDSSGTRQGQVLIPEATVAVASTGAGGRSGSALDLFV